MLKELSTGLERTFNITYYGGEAFPLIFPDLGPDIMGPMLGAELNLGEHTTWCEPNITGFEKFPDFKFNCENKWWKIVEEMTREMVADAKGDYFVSITDIHPGVDCLVALRGPRDVSLDLIDHP